MESSLLTVYLMLASFAGSPCDVLTLIKTDEYFEARHVPVNVEHMEHLAATQPADNAAHVTQLLTIRWLGEHRTEAARETLRRIAGGQLAQDRHGFARDYARRALDRLDGRTPARTATPQNSLREAVRWFPEEVVSVQAFDVTEAWAQEPFALGSPPVPGQPATPFIVLQPSLLATTPEQKEKLYQWVGRVGNIRVDRIAVASLPPAHPGGWARKLVHLTGRGDHGALVRQFGLEGVASLIGWDERAPAGPVTFLRSQGWGACAVIGDTDLLFADDPDGGEEDLAAVKQMLEVRAGRKAGVLTGPLGGALRDVPGNACGLIVGEVADENRQQLATELGLAAVPRRVIMHLALDEKANLDLSFRGFLRTPEEARAFAEGALRQRDRQADSLAELRAEPSAKSLFRALESIDVEADGSAVTGRAHIPGDLPAALGEIIPVAVG